MTRTNELTFSTLVVGVHVVTNSPLRNGCFVVLDEGLVGAILIILIPDLEDLGLVCPAWIDLSRLNFLSEVCLQNCAPL